MARFPALAPPQEGACWAKEVQVATGAVALVTNRDSLDGDSRVRELLTL